MSASRAKAKMWAQNICDETTFCHANDLMHSMFSFAQTFKASDPYFIVDVFEEVLLETARRNGGKIQHNFVGLNININAAE